VTVAQASGRPTATSFYLFLLGRGQISGQKQIADEELLAGAKDVPRSPRARSPAAPPCQKDVARYAHRPKPTSPRTKQ